MTDARAVVWDGEALSITDALAVRDPVHDEVQIAVAASGICHSDLNVIDGRQPLPAPVVLGHEGAGTVTAVGSAVEHLAVGDRVVITSMTPCGRCRSCARGRTSACRGTFGRPRNTATLAGVPVRSYASVGSFASLVTVRADQAIAVPDTIPFEQACLVGCAVTTAYGSVRHLGGVDTGQSVAVFGIGGIGANALQIARLQRAATIFAVDIDPSKRRIAEHFGATDVLIGDSDEIIEQFRAVGGVDVTIECSGAPAAIAAAVAVLAPGGTAVLVGIPPRGHSLGIDVGHLLDGRRVVGGFNGAVQPHADIPDILSLAERGDLDLGGLIGGTTPLTDYDAALARVRAGGAVRTVLLHDQ